METGNTVDLQLGNPFYQLLLKRQHSIDMTSLLYILYISDLCHDKDTNAAKTCDGSEENRNCDPATGYCGCNKGYKLNDNNDACVEGSYLIHTI